MQAQTPPNDVDFILRLCTAIGGTTPESVMAGHKHAEATRVRYVAAHIMRMRAMSYPRIAAALGYTHHTSAMYACQQAHAILAAHPEIGAIVEAELSREQGSVEAAMNAAHEARMAHAHTLAIACNDLVTAIDRALTGSAGMLAKESRRGLVTAITRVRNLALATG